MMPLAKPGWRGTMSMVTAHIGATISSAKKNAKDNSSAASADIATSMTANRQTQLPAKSRDDHGPAREAKISRCVQHGIAGNATERIARQSAEENPGRVKGRTGQRGVIALYKE